MTERDKHLDYRKARTGLGPNEGPYAPCPGIGAWAAPVIRLPIWDKVTLVEVKSGPLPSLGVPAALALASVTMK